MRQREYTQQKAETPQINQGVIILCYSNVSMIKLIAFFSMAKYILNNTENKKDTLRIFYRISKS